MIDIRPIALPDRSQVKPLLNLQAAGDAMAAYYALDHPAGRVELFGAYAADDKLRSFLARARTGFDLFRPLLIPHVSQLDDLEVLMDSALSSGESALLILPFEQRAGLPQIMHLQDPTPVSLFRLDPRRYQPQINVLVVPASQPGAWPRFEIRSGSELRAAAGVNWKNDRFAEVYLEIDPLARERPYGVAVLSALARELLQAQVIALLQLDPDQPIEEQQALEVGFRPTGERYLRAQVRRREES